jgi:hypothetical protein
MPRVEVANVWEAINYVMGKVGYVKKQRGDNLKYSYAGEAALIKAVRPHMVDVGLVLVVTGITDIHTEIYSSSGGARMTNTTFTVHGVFVHGPSGTKQEVAARGEGSDSGDKGNNKALTGGYKYILRQTFCIETGDDPDQFRPEAERKQPAKIEPLSNAGIKQLVALSGLSQADAKAHLTQLELYPVPEAITQEYYDLVKAALEAKKAGANGAA